MTDVTATGTKLLAGVAGLSVSQRLATIGREARRLAGTPELDRLLAELSAGGRYERTIAVQMATIGGARDYLSAQLDSADTEFAGRALTGLIRLGGIEPEVIVRRLPGLSRWTRQYMYRALNRGEQARLADALLPPVRALFGDAEAAQVLPFCSVPVVIELFPELAYAVPNRVSLAGRHIGVIFDYVEERASAAERDEWGELWSWLTADPTAAVNHDPDRLLALAAQAIAYVPVSSLHGVAGMLARHDVDAVYQLIRHSSGHGRGLGGPALWRALRALTDDRLGELYAGCGPHDRRKLLRTVPPSRRTAIAGALLARPGVAPGEIDMPALDALPRGERAAIAREILARPGGADIPDVAECLTARLSWEEAKPILAEAIRRPTAEERARAYPLLVAAAAGSREPEVVGELLQMLLRLRNEQDPVRSSALHAVSTIPMSLLEVPHLPALEQLSMDALDARDRSAQTSAAVGVLVRTLLLRGAQLEDAEFGATALRLLTRLGELSIPLNLRGLQHNLPHGVEHRLFAALRPRLENDAARDQWELALDLAAGLERRAHAIPELQRLVLLACTAKDDWTVRRAVALALDNPVTRDAALEDMLRRDRSLIALHEVQQLVATRRTDLLDTVLSQSTSGRFLSRSVRFVPMFWQGFGRWTPAQVDRYARLLQDYAVQRKASIGEHASAVRQLGRLPGSFDRLRPFVDAEELTVSEAALTAFGRSDEPERAIALLSEYVGGDRARVAVSGIASRARFVPANRLSETLAPLLDSPKITAVKEGIRLLAALRAPDAVPTIRALSNRPGAHRDVRRAAVFATRFLFDRDEAWELLTEAAADPEVGGAILEIWPYHLPVPQRRRFAVFVRDLAASEDQRVSVQALDALTRWYRWLPSGGADVRVDRLVDLSELGRWEAALRALLAGVAATGEPTALIAAVERLVAETNTTLPDRDLPARQRITALVNGLIPLLRNNDHARSVADPIIVLLSPDPLWHEQIIDLSFAALRWTEAARTIATIDGLSTIATGALTGYPALRLVSRLIPEVAKTPAEGLAAIATGLSLRTAPASALAAVALTSQCAKNFGWSEPWPGLLASLRAHPDADVRRVAHTVFMAPE